VLNSELNNWLVLQESRARYVLLIIAVTTGLDCVGINQLKHFVDAQSRTILLILIIIVRAATLTEYVTHLSQNSGKLMCPSHILRVTSLWGKGKYASFAAVSMHVEEHS